MVHKRENPRKVAVEVLNVVLGKKKPLKYTLTDRILNLFKNSDRAFLIEIVYGVLRNLYYLDFLLEEFFKRKETLSSLTINNLRCCIYQILFLNIPAYAAINEGVNIEKTFKGRPAVVNAILRNFLRKFEGASLQEIRERIKPPNLQIAYSHPEWLIRRWQSRFSPEELEALLKANNEKPPFCIGVKPEERDMIADYFEKKGFVVNPSRHVSSGLMIEGQGHEIIETLKKAPFFWVVQDEGSQLACFLLEPKEDLTVLDACASPGGKTLLTAALMKKGKILCLENNMKRFKILLENIDRVRKFLPNVKIEPQFKDIFKFQPPHLFDRVLLDAPCSSLGVIRRNPDVRYRVEEAEIERLSKLQREMLHKISNFVSEGGILLYSVCSTEPEEGEKVIDDFLQKHFQFCSIEIFRTYPHKDGMDGFFFAKLLKRV